jgi:hypothetical protein
LYSAFNLDNNANDKSISFSSGQTTSALKGEQFEASVTFRGISIS